MVSSEDFLYKAASNSCISNCNAAGEALRIGLMISKIGGRLSNSVEEISGTSAWIPFDHILLRAGCSHSLTRIKNKSGVSLRKRVRLVVSNAARTLGSRTA